MINHQVQDDLRECRKSHQCFKYKGYLSLYVKYRFHNREAIKALDQYVHSASTPDLESTEPSRLFIAFLDGFPIFGPSHITGAKAKAKIGGAQGIAPATGSPKRVVLMHTS